jgi:hypothetical protein
MLPLSSGSKIRERKPQVQLGGRFVFCWFLVRLFYLEDIEIFFSETSRFFLNIVPYNMDDSNHLYGLHIELKLSLSNGPNRVSISLTSPVE